jgi:flagellar biosynthesis/type III secretory pathway chaperone
MNSAHHDIISDLDAHLDLCQRMLRVVEMERDALRESDAPRLQNLQESKRDLLPQISASLDRIRQHRRAWQALNPAERSRRGDAPARMRQLQDLIMRIIVLDRENEQTLLRLDPSPRPPFGEPPAAPFRG